MSIANHYDRWRKLFRAKTVWMFIMLGNNYQPGDGCSVVKGE